MMSQWQAVKDRHPEGLVFFRMGDFFEFFHDDAVRAASLLGLTLTSRSKGDGAIPMAGVPVKTSEQYIRRLMRQGEKVVICDQVEDPAEAEGLVDRRVTRIVTPGTLTEDDALSALDNNFLAAIAVAKDVAAIAWADVSTGQFTFRATTPAKILDELQRLDPSECLVAESLAADQAMLSEWKANVRAVFTSRPDFAFDRKDAVRRLNAHFGTRSLAGFGIDEDGDPLGAAGALLEYLEETQRGAIGQVRALRRSEQSGQLVLDRATRSSLELVATLRDGDRRGSLLDAIDRTATAMGARLLKSWVLAPLADPEAIGRRQDAVEELLAGPELQGDIRDELTGILDLERLSARVGCGRAGPRDMTALRRCLEALPELRRLLADSRASLLAEAAAAIPDLSGLAARLARGLVDDPPMVLKDGGVIRDGFDAELDDLRALGREGKGFIAAFQAREAAATGIPLKVGFNQVFGFYIEITNAHRDKAPGRYIRKQTLKNAERYITEELKEYEDKVLHAEERIQRLEQRLFNSLRDEAQARLDDIQRAAAATALIDCLHGLARVAKEGGWIRPSVATGDELTIVEGRHPVLDRTAGREPFVPNDTALDERTRIMVITGPNMAGKSTYIRQTALLVILAQLGSFVPAKSAAIGVADRVFTRVGASDDLARGASTFMVEMLEVANILNNATRRSLVILDEVGRGTSTYDGLSLAWSITEHLARRIGCRTLFATHYHELVELAETVPGVANANVLVREWGDQIVFLHKIVAGAADKSYGIHVARLAGLPEVVIAAARGILAKLETGARAVAVGAPLAAVEEQLTLFQPPPDELRRRLAQLKIEETTPMQALRILEELKTLSC